MDTITISEYNAFKSLYNQGTLGEVRMGVAFCDYFDIVDEQLGGEENPSKVDKAVINKYVEW